MTERLTPLYCDPLPLPESEIFDRAAREVAKGWRQRAYGPWHEPDGAVCGAGALLRVLDQAHDEQCSADGRTSQLTARLDRQMRSLAIRLQQIIKREWPTPIPAGDVSTTAFATPGLPSFNDDPARTQDDVVALFEKARAEAAEQGR